MYNKHQSISRVLMPHINAPLLTIHVPRTKRTNTGTANEPRLSLIGPSTTLPQQSIISIDLSVRLNNANNQQSNDQGPMNSHSSRFSRYSNSTRPTRKAPMGAHPHCHATHRGTFVRMAVPAQDHKSLLTDCSF